MDGVDAEWVTEKEYLDETAIVDKKLKPTDANIVKMDHLETVMVSEAALLAVVELKFLVLT